MKLINLITAIKNIIKISFYFSLGLLTLLSFGQTECKVLKAEISLIYKGECKNGLAHGVGEALGRDFYEGEFKNGNTDKGLMNGRQEKCTKVPGEKACGMARVNIPFLKTTEIQL